MIIFGISFLDQTGNFLLSSYFFIGGREGRGRGVFPVLFWGGEGREGWEVLSTQGQLKYNNHVLLSIGSFFFSISGAIDGNHISFSLYSIFEMTTPLPSKLK